MNILILYANAAEMLEALPGNGWWTNWEFMGHSYQADQLGWRCDVSYRLPDQENEGDVAFS